jgi:hypothetical protein
VTPQDASFVFAANGDQKNRLCPPYSDRPRHQIDPAVTIGSTLQNQSLRFRIQAEMSSLKSIRMLFKIFWTASSWLPSGFEIFVGVFENKYHNNRSLGEDYVVAQVANQQLQAFPNYKWFIDIYFACIPLGHEYCEYHGQPFSGMSRAELATF